VANVKILAEMLCFHVDAAVAVSEYLLDEGEQLPVIKAILEKRGSESESVEQHALWETVKDLLEKPSLVN
jgi:hypothetical protein|tara:strand:- start:1144 stop:1353 length:210 start_codon:yes stop_codon:yes gene_type:complete